MLSLRRANGEEKRSEAAADATVKVASSIVVVDMTGGEDTSIDERIVNVASRTPAPRVVFASPTDVVRGGEELWDHGEVADTGVEDFETVPEMLGRGGWRNSTEVAKARYPSTTFVRGVWMVKPASSMIKQRTITELVATFDDQTSCSACKEGCADLLAQVRSAAIAINITSPTLVPPSCIAA